MSDFKYNIVDNETEDEIKSSDNIQNVMDNLITNMNQLKKYFAKQLNEKQPDEISEGNPIQLQNMSQTEVLLQQVQNAMESTVTKLSNQSLVFNPKIELFATSLQKNNQTNIKTNQLSTSEKWRLYSELVQKKNESSKDYCQKKMSFGQDLGLSFAETKREMLSGLLSNQLTIVLYLKNHENEEDILKDIEDWEKFERSRNMFQKYRNNTNNL